MATQLPARIRIPCVNCRCYPGWNDFTNFNHEGHLSGDERRMPSYLRLREKIPPIRTNNVASKILRNCFYYKKIRFGARGFAFSGGSQNGAVLRTAAKRKGLRLIVSRL